MEVNIGGKVFTVQRSTLVQVCCIHKVQQLLVHRKHFFYTRFHRTTVCTLFMLVVDVEVAYWYVQGFQFVCRCHAAVHEHTCLV